MTKKNPAQVHLKLRCQLHQICTYTQLYTFTAIFIAMCSSRKYPLPPPPTPDGGHFCFGAPTLLEFSFQEVLVIPPYPLQFPSFFHLNWEPPGKNISVKNPVSLYHYAKCNCFCDKMRKIFLFILMHGLTTSIFPCRGL